MKKGPFLVFFLSILIGTGSLSLAHAGIDEWTSRGPEGALTPISTMAIDPTTPTTLYAGVGSIDFGSGVFKTTNGGANWEAVNAGMIDVLATAIAIDPVTPNVIYVGSWGQGVFKTTNGGKSWRMMNTGLPNNGLYITGLAIDRKNPIILYASGYFSVFKTMDGGANWNATNTGLPEGTFIRSLAIDPANPNTLYVVSGGLYKTTNGGTNWFRTSAPYCTFLTIDPAHPNTLYIGNELNLYKSTGGGDNWNEINAGLPDQIYPGSLTVDPANPNILYLGTSYSGMFKSVNGGESWNVINDLSGVGNLIIDPMSNTIYGSSEKGVLKSKDSGVTWEAISTGLPSPYATEPFTIDPTHSKKVYVGVGGELFKSTDYGANWKAITSVLIPDTLVVDPQHSYILYAGGVTGVLKSTDGGVNWMDASTGLPNNSKISALTIDPLNPNVLYTASNGLFKSINGANSWKAITGDLPSTDIRTIAIDPVEPTKLYAGLFNDGVFKSTDRGATWQAINTGLDGYKGISWLVIDPKNPNTLYVGYAGNGLEVFKSIDGGENWHPFDFFGYPFLAIDPIDSNMLYGGAYPGGVIRSTDGGVSWDTMNEGLTCTHVYAVIVDPDYPILYALTMHGGVFSFQRPGPTPRVTLFAPHGREVIPAGSNYRIEWGAPPQAVKFKLLYSIDYGTTWVPINQKYVTGTSYEWTVPKPRENKRLCHVKVVGYDENNIRVGADKSYAPVTIEVVKLTSPDGWENFASGSNQIITWQVQGTKNTVNDVELSYTKNGGFTWFPITTLPGDTRTFEGPVPTVLNLKTKCKVKVVLKDLDGKTVGSDVSDSYFTIQPATIP